MHEPVHPGVIVKGALIDNTGLTVTEAAIRLGVARITLSRLLNGHTGISSEMALRLSKFFGTSVEVWMNLQSRYDAWTVKERNKEEKSTSYENMKFIEISAGEELIEALESLYSGDSYIFRGHQDKRFYLQPGFFREDQLRELFKEFSNLTNCSRWKPNAFTEKMISKYEKISPFPIYIKRIKMITLYTMMYNFFLSKYAENIQYEHERSNIMLDEKSLEFYRIKPSKYWIEEKTFQRGFYENMNAAEECYSLDGAILKEGTIYNILTSADEKLPQHYGIKAAALDWTYNPYIAIFFALRHINSYPVENATHFSIFAYRKSIQEEGLPIVVEEGLVETKNPRIIAQEGCFTDFKQACSFYYSYGRWPCIEDYTYNNLTYQGKFDLIKYSISLQLTPYFHEILEKKEINQYSLKL